ncbi:general secretion pathway protein F/type IV pilus assembly protein PilC [Neorhodopirellula lusitana]|uniref:General secretion pathway protein F/type IV pilus assembly protein PilC n=1 Tax=Neorhodopirellula lusitana TaxID=445327 RepID=A0ABY1QB80_9BACT|nr:type II secretion system F family protein [Neorhodopirellula lusitana]SMP61781.1 general secretion pathway protein F/type IV pilus assembly protein PilC [Neorhodopirellula lusitana]
MPAFQYTARDSTGKSVTGVIDAANSREASSLLAGQELFPTKIEEKKTNSVRLFGAKRKKVSGQNMAVFYTQLASLLRSGVPMIRSLTLLGSQSTTPVLGEVLAEIRTRVEDGEPLGDAMARFPGVFSGMGVNMVKAGMEGGFLEDALDRVGVFTELQEDLKGRTVSAMAYPAFLFVVGTVVVTGLLVFFVPKFDMLFDRLRKNGDMPAMTEWLLAFSNFLQAYGLFMLAGMVIAFFAVRMHLQTDEGMDRADHWKLKIPVLGEILMNLSVARFCRVLGTLLGNGVPILKSLDISRSATGNRLLSRSIGDATENIRSGESLAKPLGDSGYFPMAVVEMIRVGEESNSLDRVLPEIADSLEKRTFRRLDLFVRLLEPIMLLVMAILVLAVVMALLIPVLKSSTSL